MEGGRGKCPTIEEHHRREWRDESKEKMEKETMKCSQ